MIRWIALLVGVLVIANWWRKLYQRRGRSILPATFFALALIILTGLAIAGKMHWIGAAFVSLLWGLRQLAVILFRYWPLLSGLWSRVRGHQAGGSGAGGVHHAKMSTKQALAVLGLNPGASKEEVLAAHRKLIQKLHPDRGGNDHLTRTVNQARDVLLKNLE